MQTCANIPWAGSVGSPVAPECGGEPLVECLDYRDTSPLPLWDSSWLNDRTQKDGGPVWVQLGGIMNPKL